MSGYPIAHGLPLDTQPISLPPETSGPPESPKQVPSPLFVYVQISASLIEDPFSLHSLRLSALKFTNCKWSGLGEEAPVRPQPLTTASLFSSLWSLSQSIGWIVSENSIGFSKIIRPMSLDGWAFNSLTAYRFPPSLNFVSPQTTVIDDGLDLKTKTVVVFE